MKGIQGTAEVNGTSLFYTLTGEGQAIVFVHGMALDRRMWDEQVVEFSNGYRSICYDLRGYGKSALPGNEPYSHHEDLLALLDFLQIDKATLVGLSMGGRVVTDFGIAYPERTRALILIDTALHGYAFKTFSIENIIEEAHHSGLDSANLTCLNHELFKSARNNKRASPQLAKIIREYSGWHWIHPNPWIPLKPSSVEQLYKIISPTLILAGELDLPDFLEIAEFLSQKITGARAKIIPGAGHMCNMEEPELVNQAIKEFLENLHSR